VSRNLQKEVTDRIVTKLREGVVPWKQPWTGKASGIMPRNAITKRAYSGVNVLLLWCKAQERGYEVPEWMTFKQATDAGAYVRKGEKSEMVVFVSTMEKLDDDGKPYFVPFLKAFNVFNVAQIEGLEQSEEKPTINENEPVQDAEEFIASTGAVIRHGESRAYYQPKADFIMLPDFQTFASASAYYAIAFHELIHWTNAIEHGRLDRGSRFGRKFGDSAYSAEELVAELGSAFMCAEFGFDNATIDNSAAYIDHWIKFLTDHDGAIVTAASAASKAVEFMRGLAISDISKAA